MFRRIACRCSVSCQGPHSPRNTPRQPILLNARGISELFRGSRDVGCGRTGRFIDLLMNAGYSVEGVDISEQMIAQARQRHPKVTFYHQDICQWVLPSTYDFITAWDSIWHIPLAQQKPVLSKLVDALTPGGVLIFSCGGTDTAGEHTNTSMGPEVYYSTLGINGFLTQLLSLSCVIRHVEYDQYPELHTYLIVQKAHAQTDE